MERLDLERVERMSVQLGVESLALILRRSTILRPEICC